MASVSAASINFGCPFNPARSVTAIQNTSISVSTINHASPSERFSRFRLSASAKPDILRVMELVNKQIAEKNENRGSVEFQVFSMTNKIRRLTQHLEEHKKDFASSRGLKITLGKRKRLLAYLTKKLKKGGSLAF